MSAMNLINRIENNKLDEGGGDAGVVNLINRIENGCAGGSRPGHGVGESNQ